MASVCGAAGSEDYDMEGRGERVNAAVRVQARAQFEELLVFLSDFAT